MAESLIPEVIPGLVQVKRTGPDDKNTGEKKGTMKTVYPIDAKDLLSSGEYELVENGAVEAARINANPLRNFALNPKIVAVEVTGIAGQVQVGANEEETQELIKAADNGGKEVPTESALPKSDAPVRDAENKVSGKAAGQPIGAKTEADKK